MQPLTEMLVLLAAAVLLVTVARRLALVAARRERITIEPVLLGVLRVP